MSEILDKLLKRQIFIPKTGSIVKRYSEILEEIQQINNYILQDKNNIENIFDCPALNANDESFNEIKSMYKEMLSEIDPPSEIDTDYFQDWFKGIMEKLFVQITQPEIPSDIDHVRIMSLHSSKGLSAKLVIITTAIEQLLNYVPSDLSESEDNRMREEQRRLFYVAITRCKCVPDEFPGRLVISSCTQIKGKEALKMNIPSSADQNRKVHSTQFIQDMGPKCPKVKRGEELID